MEGYELESDLSAILTITLPHLMEITNRQISIDEDDLNTLNQAYTDIEVLQECIKVILDKQMDNIQMCWQFLRSRQIEKENGGEIDFKAH